MKPNLQTLWIRLLELIGTIDKEEKENLEIALMNSNWEGSYDLAQKALDRLDAQIRQNKRLREEARQLHALARSINEMLG